MSIRTNAAELKNLQQSYGRRLNTMKSHISAVTDGPRRGYDDIADETLTATRRRSSVMNAAQGEEAL